MALSFPVKISRLAKKITTTVFNACDCMGCVLALLQCGQLFCRNGEAFYRDGLVRSVLADQSMVLCLAWEWILVRDSAVQDDRAALDKNGGRIGAAIAICSSSSGAVGSGSCSAIRRSIFLSHFPRRKRRTFLQSASVFRRSGIYDLEDAVLLRARRGCRSTMPAARRPWVSFRSEQHENSSEN